MGYTYREGWHPVGLLMTVIERILTIPRRYGMAMNVNSFHCRRIWRVGVSEDVNVINQLLSRRVVADTTEYQSILQKEMGVSLTEAIFRSGE